MVLSYAAQSARGLGQPIVPQTRGRQGRHARRAVPDPLEGRGRPRARQGDRRLLVLGRRARHERLHLHRPRHHLHRRRRRRRVLRRHRRDERPAARRRPVARARHDRGGREDAATPTAYVKELLDNGERLMGFGHRVYRAEDPRARVLRRTAKELDAPRYEVAEALEKAALAELRGAPSRPGARDQRGVLGRDRARLRRGAGRTCSPRCSPAPAPAAGRRTSSSRRRTGRLIRPSAIYAGPATRPAERHRGLERRAGATPTPSEEPVA